MFYECWGVCPGEIVKEMLCKFLNKEAAEQALIEYRDTGVIELEIKEVPE